jgi:hypothetical protein
MLVMESTLIKIKEVIMEKVQEKGEIMNNSSKAVSGINISCEVVEKTNITEEILIFLFVMKFHLLKLQKL